MNFRLTSMSWQSVCLSLMNIGLQPPHQYQSTMFPCWSRSKACFRRLTKCPHDLILADVIHFPVELLVQYTQYCKNEVPLASHIIPCVSYLIFTFSLLFCVYERLAYVCICAKHEYLGSMKAEEGIKRVKLTRTPIKKLY